MAPARRQTGIEVVGEVPWDTHFCVFYHDANELLSIVVPYIKAGLDSNEACVWVISEVITMEEAKTELGKHFSDLPERMRTGQLEILKAAEWYTRNGNFDAKEVLSAWKEKAMTAKARGFDGIRATGDTSWLHNEQWGRFVEYESVIGEAIDQLNMLVLCTYSLNIWEAYQVIDVVSTHEFALIKVGDKWRQIENSERRKAIEDSLSAEEKYGRAVKNIHVAVYSALPDDLSTTVLLTDKIQDITGYSADEFLSNADLYGKMVHPDDREMLWSAVKEHRKRKSPLSVEYRIIRKSGEVRWVKDEANPVFDENGKIIRIDGFIEDITDRKKLIDTVRDSEERFELAQKAANIGSWDWDIISGGLVWSDEVEPMFGFSKGAFERTYESFLRLIHPEDRQRVSDAVDACVEGSIPYDIEHRIIWPDGSVHWMSEKGDVVRDHSGKAVRMLGVVRDVTRQKFVEQEIFELNLNLQRRSEELAAANKELEAFAYSVSHDLRAPLRRIDGFSEILLRESPGNLDKAFLDNLKRIRTSVKDMNGLIEGMLKLSRLSIAEIAVRKVDLSGLARSAGQRLKASEPDRKIDFSVEDGLTVMGDADLLSIALENLIGNSWKFTGKRQDARIEFGSEMVDGHTAYFVRDNGAGFDKNRADKLFAPFQRMHSDSEYPGYGIGLALVSRVVSRHKGKVWAESEPDKGATFYFTLGDLAR